jgi:hypothetical protein
VSLAKLGMVKIDTTTLRARDTGLSILGSLKRELGDLDRVWPG